MARHLKGTRRRAMARVAALSFVDLEEYGPEVSILKESGLSFFMEGRGGVGKLLLRMPPAEGISAYYFDYSAMLGAEDAQHERNCTMALFRIEKCSFPEFHLSAGGDVPNEASGLDPADMAAFGDFPPEVKLYGRVQDGLKSFFTKDMAYSFREHPGWSAQGAGKWLLLYKGCSLVEPSAYNDFMAEANKLALNLS